jgi:hypothetical protein
MTPDEFNKWLAFRQIYPDKMERLIHICKHGFALLANSWGAHIEPDDIDTIRREEQPTTATPDQAAAVATCALGKPNGYSNR